MDSAYSDFLCDKRVILLLPTYESMLGVDFIDGFDIVVRYQNLFNHQHPGKLGTRTDVLYSVCSMSLDYILKMFEFALVDGVRWVVGPHPENVRDVNDPNYLLPGGFVNYSDFKNRFGDKFLFRCPSNPDAVEEYKKISKRIGTRIFSGMASIIDLLNFPLKELFVAGHTFCTTKSICGYPSAINYGKEDSNHLLEPQRIFLKELLEKEARFKVDAVTLKVLYGKSLTYEDMVWT